MDKRVNQIGFLSGLFLSIVVGGSALFAAIVVFRQYRHARTITFICSVTILLWITVQVAIIGYVSWMQPATTFVTITILLLNWKIPTHGY